ncbi:MAG: FtsW/RodA/SpoVE family cell cycle protein [Phycisphaerales bacterium]|nr:FtsW/RodA/SpoVE family cell cycle protein [Phycisphaerales bacterium]
MLRPGHIVTLCVLALLMLGVVMVNSALMTVDPVDGQGVQAVGVTAESIILSKSTAYMGLALAALAGCALLPVRGISRLVTGPIERDPTPQAGLRTLTLCVLGLLGVLALVYLPVIGREVNGSARWIRVAGQSIQPSEIVKWGLLALIAWYGAVRAKWLPSFRWGLLPALVATGGVCLFVVKEDLGTGVLIAASCCIVLLAGGARVLHFAAFIPLGLVGVAGAIITSPYRVERILAFLDPWADPQDTGYHMIQSMAAIAGGGGPGRGLGHGFQKFGYLPEDHTDFLFAIVCEELGIIGAALVLGLYVLLVLTGLGIVRREPDRLLKLLGLGIVTTIGLQAVINLFVVTGMAPTKGIALPLMSSGGTGWILTAACLGLLVAMDRTQPRPVAYAEDAGEAAESDTSAEIALREPKAGALRGGTVAAT